MSNTPVCIKHWNYRRHQRNAAAGAGVKARCGATSGLLALRARSRSWVRCSSRLARTPWRTVQLSAGSRGRRGRRLMEVERPQSPLFNHGAPSHEQVDPDPRDGSPSVSETSQSQRYGSPDPRCGDSDSEIRGRKVRDTSPSQRYGGADSETQGRRLRDTGAQTQRYGGADSEYGGADSEYGGADSEIRGRRLRDTGARAQSTGTQSLRYGVGKPSPLAPGRRGVTGVQGKRLALSGFRILDFGLLLAADKVRGI